jgi:two-component system, NarL family, nitrate/nitrite response regulator NarL
MSNTRILLVDDKPKVGLVIRQILTQKSEWEVCGEASSGDDAVQKAQILKPDLAILDIAMAGGNGLEAGRQIHSLCPSTAVLLVSMYDPSSLMTRMKENGIQGFVSKACIGTELIPAIEALLSGGTYFRTETGQPDA